jgi:hypothetical protein
MVSGLPGQHGQGYARRQGAGLQAHRVLLRRAAYRQDRLADRPGGLLDRYQEPARGAGGIANRFGKAAGRIGWLTVPVACWTATRSRLEALEE